MIQVFNIHPHLYYGTINLEALARTQGLSAKREIECAGRDMLLRHLVGNESTVRYDDKGKPYLNASRLHISISHSHEKLAIIVNEQEPTGIDIELIRDKVIRIRHKFLSPPELEDAGMEVEKLLVYWSAKETLYKIYGLKEVDFIAHLFIAPFSYTGKGFIYGTIKLGQTEKKFELRYEKTEDYILVIAIKQIA
ncbi:MAG: 4'-phosphopantetheinyl transferase superfamily protein [Bacteroidetes bacterium]|nr:4'-phosphopantetheinyl transferase superfamily protein [Bacteroidota bacterium]